MPVFERLTAFGFTPSAGQPTYRYLLVGDTRKPVLMLVSGYMETHSSFQRLAKYLTKQYCVVIPDLPGWDESSSKPWTVQEYVGYMKALLDFLGLPSVRMVGHCVGNALVVAFAQSYPRRVQEIFLVSVPQLEGFFRTPLAIRKKMIGKVKQHIKQQSNYVHAAAEKHWESYAELSFHSVTRLPVTIHLLHGSNDTFVRPYKVARIAGSSKKVTWDVLLGVGHLPAGERPEALAAVILGYSHFR